MRPSVAVVVLWRRRGPPARIDVAPEPATTACQGGWRTPAPALCRKKTQGAEASHDPSPQARCGAGARERPVPGGRHGAGRLPGTADHPDRALGCGRRHRRHRPHDRKPARGTAGPAGQRGEPHRRQRRRGPLGDRQCGARRLHAGRHHGRDWHDALGRPDRPDRRGLHPDRALQLRSRGPAGASRFAVAERPGCARCGRRSTRRAQGVRHWPGRHLASGARRHAR